MKSITDILIDFELNLEEVRNQKEKQEVIDMIKRTDNIINSKESHNIQDYFNIMYNANVLTINDLKHIDKKCAQHYYDNVLTVKNILDGKFNNILTSLKENIDSYYKNQEVDFHSMTKDELIDFINSVDWKR